MNWFESTFEDAILWAQDRKQDTNNSFSGTPINRYVIIFTDGSAIAVESTIDSDGEPDEPKWYIYSPPKG